MKVVYRVLNAMMGAGVLVAAVLANFVKITIGTTESLDSFFKSITDDASSGIAVAETFSIKRFILFFNGKDDLSSLLSINKKEIFLWPKIFQPINARLVVFLISCVLIIALAIFVIVFSCASGRRMPMLIAGILGVAFTIVFIRMFNSISFSILSGEVNLVDYIVDSLLGEGVLLKLLGSVASSAIVIYLTLAGVHIWFFVLFLAIALWTAIFYLVDLGDPEAKKQREEEKKALQAKKDAKKAKKEAKKAAKAEEPAA